MNVVTRAITTIMEQPHVENHQFHEAPRVHQMPRT